MRKSSALSAAGVFLISVAGMGALTSHADQAIVAALMGIGAFFADIAHSLQLLLEKIQPDRIPEKRHQDRVRPLRAERIFH